MVDYGVIQFQAVVYKVQTLVDGGIRLTLDMPQTAVQQMAMLAECQLEGIPLIFESRADNGLDGTQTDKKHGRT